MIAFASCIIFFFSSLHLLNSLHLNPHNFLGFALPVLSPTPLRGRKQAIGRCVAAGLGQLTKGTERHLTGKSVSEEYPILTSTAFTKLRKQVLLIFSKALNN